MYRRGYLRGLIDPERLKNNRPLWCSDKTQSMVEKSTKQICHVVTLHFSDIHFSVSAPSGTGLAPGGT